MKFNDFRIIEAKEEKLVHGSNRGNIAEAILGAAITAKFVKGEEKITVDDVKKVFSQIAKSENLAGKFDSEQANDKVFFKNVISNKKNIADIKEVDETFRIMAEEVEGTVRFANSDVYTTRLSKVFAENGKPDNIYVKAVGEEDQKGTKADIFLAYKGEGDEEERILRPISIKTGSNLIGQGSPRTFAGIQNLMSDLGISVEPIDNYEDNVNEHVISILKQAVDDIKKFTSGDDDNKESKLIQNIGGFLNKHAGLNDPKLIIANIGKGDYSAQKISKLISNLPNVDLDASFKSGGRPAVLVHEAGNPRNLLFQIRYTYQAPRFSKSQNKEAPERHRMFVEVGPLFKKLGTVFKRDM